MFFNLTESAARIGISRAWLYRKYLARYRPTIIARRPVLSREQIAQIKAEIRAEERQKPNGNGHK
jgi:predicted DNA-binding transcriptional regulator AlpA